MLGVLLSLVCLAHPAIAAEPAPSIGCRIERLEGNPPPGADAWRVSIEKEATRKKPGDAFLGIHSTSGLRCEIELPSWGVGLYLARSRVPLFIVEQEDTMYTTLTWIDPKSCKILKSLREFGAAKVTGSKISFSGGKDGPEKVEGKDFRVGADCLP